MDSVLDTSQLGGGGGIGRRTGAACANPAGIQLWLRRHWRLTLGTLAMAAAGAALLTAFHARRSAVAVAPYPHELAQVSFAVAGDVIPHEAVRDAAAAAGQGETGLGRALRDVADVFQGVDFGFVNLETPVAPEHSRGSKPSCLKRRWRCPRR